MPQNMIQVRGWGWGREREVVWKGKQKLRAPVGGRASRHLKGKRTATKECQKERAHAMLLGGRWEEADACLFTHCPNA